MKKINLLLVDDDPISLLIARKYISNVAEEDVSISISSYDKPLSALEEIRSKRVAFQECTEAKKECWVLLDINMPVLDGWDFLNELDSFDPYDEIKVVMHSSSINEEDKIKAFCYSRVKGFIPKAMTLPKTLDFINVIRHN